MGEFEHGISTFTVRTTESDPFGTVRPDSLLNYMQEAAVRHAADLGFGHEDMKAHQTFWVLARLAVTFISYPPLGSSITVDTWPTGINGPFAYRSFSLSHGNAAVSTATSAWLILNAETKKPHRPEKLLHMKGLAAMARAASEEATSGLQKILFPRCENHSLSPHLPVVYTDLDINNHVNNVRLIERALNAVPGGEWQSRALSGLEANFLSEVSRNDFLAVRMDHGTAANTTIADVIKKADGETACRTRLRWEDR